MPEKQWWHTVCTHYHVVNLQRHTCTCTLTSHDSHMTICSPHILISGRWYLWINWNNTNAIHYKWVWLTCTDVTWPWCPQRTANGAEVCPHHTLTVLSRLPVAIMWLSWLTLMSVISALCPRRVATREPFLDDHTFTKSSSAPYNLPIIY